MSARAVESQGWIDVSVPLTDGMVHWPDNPPVSVSRQLDREKGDPCNVSALSLGAHTGTHVDAPVHFVDGGRGVDALDLGVGMGPARVVEVPDPVCVTADAVAGIDPRPGERILFKTANSPRAWEKVGFDGEAVYLDGSASEALARAGVALVGIDYLSVAGYSCGNGDPAHRPLLERGAWILEGLDLSGVDPGEYELCCFPLRLVGGDASPVRALLRPSAAGGGA
ncbi:MAG: cyclase family protein [Acidimicrobiales bacterium]